VLGKRGDAELKRGRSILQPDTTRSTRKCYLTGRTDNLQLHHCFPGKNRKISDEYGFWVYLTADLHNGNDPAAVHNNPNQGWDLKLKQDCQRKYEETHSRSDFMKLVGRNYLED
jgi:hypothetical protein